LNGIKIDEGSFHTLPQEKRDDLLFSNLEKLSIEVSEIKGMLRSRWKINTVITGVCSFFGGFSAWFICSYYQIFPGGK